VPLYAQQAVGDVPGLECELIDRRRFRSHSEARMAVFPFIEDFIGPGLSFAHRIRKET
jgi:hypothetical protein